MTDDNTLVDRAELDDIIGVAARKKQVAEDSLTVEEVKEVAAELDIDEEYVDAAVHELERRRRAADKRRQRDEERARRLRKAGLGVVGAIAVICLVMFGISYARLSSSLSAAEQQRAQVDNVVERQAATLEQYEGQPTSIEKNAALEGAENRVRIEVRRYDEAAGAYNKVARGLFGGVVTSVVGMPEQLPLSNQIEAW
ncbi:MAG: hypothetical protein ACQEVA_16435 [Myxococcota bacterium]